jgi:predicted aspartyl protease
MAGIHRSGAAGQRVYELADGTEIRFDVTVAELEIVGGAVLFGEPHTQPLLGVTALESAGLEVDPVSRELRRLPNVRL